MLTFSSTIALTNQKLHIAEEMVVHHKLGSFSDGGSLCLPVFLDRHVAYRKASKSSRYLFSLVAVGNPIKQLLIGSQATWNSARLRPFSLLPDRNGFYCVFF